MIFTDACSSFCLAMMSAPGGGQGGQSQGLMIGWLVIMVALFYFMLIRPQQRKEKERKNMVDNIKSGDRVVFGGGLLGTVTNVKEQMFTIKIADNTKIDVIRASVTKVLEKDEEIAGDRKE
jgi:preprotein translocase subunit YajC